MISSSTRTKTALVAFIFLLIATPVSSKADHMQISLGQTDPNHDTVSTPTDAGKISGTAPLSYTFFDDGTGDTLASVTSVSDTLGVRVVTAGTVYSSFNSIGQPGLNSTDVQFSISKQYLIDYFHLKNDGQIQVFNVNLAEVGATVNYNIKKPDGSIVPMSSSIPELDPGSMASALTLLVGGMLVLTGRRRWRSLAVVPR